VLIAGALLTSADEELVLLIAALLIAADEGLVHVINATVDEFHSLPALVLGGACHGPIQRQRILNELIRKRRRKGRRRKRAPGCTLCIRSRMVTSQRRIVSTSSAHMVSTILEPVHCSTNGVEAVLFDTGVTSAVDRSTVPAGGGGR
jgi:hypothetical protein